MSNKKIQVARNSAIASFCMAVLKLAVGFLTGSLALISEGLHSGIDFFATLTTFISVRAAERPADREHHYGHGKLENLSAFAQSMLLLGTAVLIVIEAVGRLQRAQAAQAEAAKAGSPIYWAAMGVVALSIGVDLSRSIALSRAAKKYHSQALEADGIHFKIELISSSVVLAGLVLIKFGGPAFAWADPTAAICVAIAMTFVAGNLAKRSADVLTDRAPEGIEEEMQRAIHRVPGVARVPRVRARQSGANTFVDATITVDASLGLKGGHQVASLVETAITQQYPQTDIFVHVEPEEQDYDDHATVVRELAKVNDLRIHALRIRDILGGLYITFHLELPAEMTLARAHELVTDLEEKIRERIPKVAEIDSHLEPAEEAEDESRAGGTRDERSRDGG